jgi:hypothetical protein
MAVPAAVLREEVVEPIETGDECRVTESSWTLYTPVDSEYRTEVLPVSWKGSDAHIPLDP